MDVGLEVEEEQEESLGEEGVKLEEAESSGSGEGVKSGRGRTRK